ncbi:hypothetical protein DFP72DRAFT_821775 [Ephemerocybe angulata]|uniref:MULE transposase domain-containing protein n=1 Tax=Ephemerocybe angulata TaxID=980116 RepID=A0A8H6HJ92_9AGAR|nr:hypothetical protein DFP72DRAFT_821775 [Tulosesus angulatus]
MTCKKCSDKRKADYKAAKVSNKENEPDTDHEDDDPGIDVGGLSVMSLDKFLDMLGDMDAVNVEAHVDIKEVVAEVGENPKTQANKLAECIWKETKYRYVYDGLYYSYHCSQLRKRQKKPKKGVKEGVKQRDKMRMISFDCHGWLHIRLSSTENTTAHVKLKHQDEHIPYWRVDVPEAVQDFVRKNSELPMDKIWDQILKDTPHPVFSRSAVANIWREVNSKKWKRDEDEVKSAMLLLQELSKGGDGLDARYTVEVVQLPEIDGFTAVAFVVPHLLRIWKDNMREIMLDSTWKTNGSNYECFGLLGEVHNSGCPLGYLLIRSVDGEAGGKEQYIKHLLNYIKTKWKITPIVTLSDKDLSEINAFLSAVKKRLAINRRQPKHYDVQQAVKEFPKFIDPKFVPIGQVAEADRASLVRHLHGLEWRFILIINTEYLRCDEAHPSPDSHSGWCRTHWSTTEVTVPRPRPTSHGTCCTCAIEHSVNHPRTHNHSAWRKDSLHH